MCKRDTESLKVAPKSVLSNRGENLQGTHLTEEGFLRVRFSPGGEVISGMLSPGVISVHRTQQAQFWSCTSFPHF